MKYLLVLLTLVSTLSLLAVDTYVVTVTRYWVQRKEPAHFFGTTFGTWTNRASAEYFAAHTAWDIAATNGLHAEMEYGVGGNYEVVSYQGTAHILHWYVETITITNVTGYAP